MIEPNLNVTPNQRHLFGLLLLPFAAGLATVVYFRGQALILVAIFLAVAWGISMIFNAENRPRQLLGALLPAACAAMGLPLRTGADAPTVAAIVWGIATAVGLGVILWPAFGRAVYIGWSLAAVPIGWTLSHAVLGLVYYGAITPIGLILRVLGHDPMRRRREADPKTYWVPRQSVAKSKQYFRQY